MLRTEHKGYAIVPDGTFGNKVIKKTGGRGPLPQVLKGSFSNHANAANAINRHLTSKGKKDDKENNAG